MPAMSRIGATLAAAATTGVFVGSVAACGPPPANCGRVVYIPNSDAGAVHILATKTACSTARGLVVAGETAPHAYHLYDFYCTAKQVNPQGLAYKHYSCVGANGRLVTWDSYP